MGGGNAQKSATARARNLEKQQSTKNAGGGKVGRKNKCSFNMCFHINTRYLSHRPAWK